MSKGIRNKKYSSQDLTSKLNLTPGDVLQLTPTLLDPEEGVSVAFFDDVEIVVVGGIKGESAHAVVVKVFNNRIITEVVNIDAPSPHRVIPPCKYFIHQCSGCQLQHISYSQQLKIKHQTVAEALDMHPSVRATKVLPVEPSPQPFGYRNHARFTVGKYGINKGKLGFVNTYTRRFVPIDQCLLMNTKINAILTKMNSIGLDGYTQVSVRTGTNTGDILIQPKIAKMSDTQTGQKFYQEKVCDSTFQVSSPSFFQVNTLQLESLILNIVSLLQLKPEHKVLDAYCGVGTMAILIAPYVLQVVGIEESSAAIANAHQNAVSHSNVEFINAKVENYLPTLAEQESKIHCVILDPPRIGCDTKVIQAVRKASPDRIALISCDIRAFVRDATNLADNGFILELVKPFDMFPHTKHIELLGIFSRS